MCKKRIRDLVEVIHFIAEEAKYKEVTLTFLYHRSDREQNQARTQVFDSDGCSLY